MATRQHLYTPTATFKFTANVPFVADQGKVWNIAAPDIGQQTSAAKTLEGVSTVASYIEHNGTMYMPQVGGICLKPLYAPAHTDLSTFTGTGDWILIDKDSSGWKMIEYPVDKVQTDPMLWSTRITKTISGSDKINASFCITFRHKTSPSTVAGTAAEFRVCLGQSTSIPLALWWKEGCNYLKVIDQTKVGPTFAESFDDPATDAATIQSISLLRGADKSSIFGEDTVALTVLFIGNHMLIGNGLPDDKGIFYGETVIKGQPKVDPSGNVVVPNSQAASTDGQAEHSSPSGEGEYGGGTGISLKYDVGTIYVEVRGAQFDLAWVPITFPVTGSFLCCNTSIPSDLKDDTKHVTRYLHVNTSAVEFTDYIALSSGIYVVTLTRATSGDANATPVWYRISGWTEPTIIVLPTTIEITDQFIYSISGTEYPDRKEYTVEMRNREGQWKNLNGCYPVTLSFGWQYSDPLSSTETLHLTGFVTRITYNRDPKLSTVTLTLVDKKIVMQDAWASNLPIYDGWYDTDVIKDLSKRSAIVTSDDLTVADTVFSDGWDPMRLSIGSFKDVIWMFTEGMPLWDCALKVAAYTGCWLYFDAQGRLNYRHPGKEIPIREAISATNPLYQFKEVQKVGNFNEIKRLTLEKDFANTVNRVVVQGATPFYAKDLSVFARMIPEDLESFERDMHDSMKEGFIPWNKTKVFREPYYNTTQAVQRIAAQYYKRLSRPFYTVSWDTWGQPQLFPLDIVRIYEQFPGGDQSVGSEKDDRYYIISSITHQLNAQDKSYTSTINADLLFPDWQYDFQLWET